MRVAVADPISAVLVVLGLLVPLLGVVLTSRKARRVTQTANRLMRIALEGRPEEARIQARTEGKTMAPVLDALGGEPAPPDPRPLSPDVVWILAMQVMPLALLGYAVPTLHAGAPEARIAVTQSLLLGLALLLPTTMISAVAVVVMARRAARVVRGTCTTMLARNVKGLVDAQMSEALRRGAHLRDPRGE